MNYTECPLKKALAAMLPDLLEWMEQCIQGGKTILLFKKQSRQVGKLEYLGLCALVEDSLDVNPESGDSPRYTYSRELYKIVPESRQPFRATWEQRTVALAKVKGITI